MIRSSCPHKADTIDRWKKIVVSHHQQNTEGDTTSSSDLGEEEGGVEVHIDGEEKLFLMVLGIVLSITSIACISNYVKKELYEVSESVLNLFTPCLRNNALF